MKRSLAATALLVLFTTPAFADHCPKDVKTIDATLSKASLSSSQMSQVKNLRDEGARLHQSGKHGDSLAALHKALDVLGQKH